MAARLVFSFPFSMSLCTWTEDEGLTFLPWLAEGQYYRKRRQSCPILKLWGLIFLKSLAIVFDKSIWEAFRERIRDTPWPSFLPPPPLSLPLRCRYWTRVLIKCTSKRGTATFSNTPPLPRRRRRHHPSLRYHHPYHLSFSPQLTFSPSVPFIFSSILHLLLLHTTLVCLCLLMLNDSVWARGHIDRASWCLDSARGRRVKCAATENG